MPGCARLCPAAPGCGRRRLAVPANAIALSIAATTALAAPIAAYALGRPDVAIMSGLLAALIYWLHRANIQRILKGEEPRIGDKKKSEQENRAETEEN